MRQIIVYTLILVMLLGYIAEQECSYGVSSERFYKNVVDNNLQVPTAQQVATLCLDPEARTYPCRLSNLTYSVVEANRTRLKESMGFMNTHLSSQSQHDVKKEALRNLRCCVYFCNQSYIKLLFQIDGEVIMLQKENG